MSLRTLYDNILHFANTPAMPVLFIGHGSPMNAIERNVFSIGWSKLAKKLPTPSAILCISAHWQTQGTLVHAAKKPRTIHDFYGFPEELYQQHYLAKGSPYFASQIQQNVTYAPIELDHQWGLDHGCWSILKHLYPQANIPVFQLSLDQTKDANYHYQFAKELAFLRNKGVLIIGSGNMVHNLQILHFTDNFNAPLAYDWALEINALLKSHIMTNEFAALVNYPTLHRAISLAVPTPEHYLPLLYTLALKNEQDTVTFFNDRVIAGSLSMTSVLMN